MHLTSLRRYAELPSAYHQSVDQSAIHVLGEYDDEQPITSERPLLYFVLRPWDGSWDGERLGLAEERTNDSDR